MTSATRGDPAADASGVLRCSRPLPWSDSLVFAAQTGVRYGADHRGAAVVETFFAVLASGAELGVTASYESSYWRWQKGAPAEPSAESAALGVRVGKRHRALGGQWLLGGQVQIAARLQREPLDPRQRPPETRTGAYVGWVQSEGLPVALRTTLALDLLPAELGRSLEEDEGLPLSPWWALTLGAGAQFGGA